MKSTNLTWGLFNRYLSPFSTIKHFFKDVAIATKRFFFVLKHGYYPQANWETYVYFIDMYKDILTWYRNERTGTPCIKPYEEENNEKLYNDMLDKMLYYLDVMGDDSKPQQLRKMCCKQFFTKFSEHFYGFWD